MTDFGVNERNKTSMTNIRVVVRDILEHNAGESPNETCVEFEDATSWTRAEGLAEAYAAGNALRALGVERDDRVALFLPNGKDFLRAWWGASVIGAVIVPINTAYRGDLLEHQLTLSTPRLAVVAPQFAEQMDSSELGASLQRVAPGDLDLSDKTPPQLDQPIRLWDSHMLALTSGTTGPSKLAEISYQAAYTGGSWFATDWGADEHDNLLMDLPLFHAGPLYQAVAALSCGARLTIRTAPELSRYWEVARETGATMALLLSSMVPYLMSQPASDADRDHSIRLMLAAPLPADVQAFVERFGVKDIVTGYGSTEQTISMARAPGEDLVEGYCGRVRKGFEVRIVDEFDIEVPVGQVGEAIVRHDQPWHLMTGYVNNPAAQAEVTRNGWFHTGDLMRRDEDGNFFFADRNKDSLRRRGENISSYEVEAVVNSFPGVAESACVAYRAPELVDDEVKVWILPVAHREVDPEELFLYCVEHMPHFMVPQYIEVVDEIPKTPTARPKKYLLRERGNSEATWDRAAHGYSLTRRGLERNLTT